MNPLNETALVIKARTVAKRRDLAPGVARKLLRAAARLEALIHEKNRLARKAGDHQLIATRKGSQGA